MDNTCWKCGQPAIEGNVECAKCANVTVTYSEGMAIRRVDWNKVKTLDDMKQIFKVFGMQVVAGSPAEDALRDYLEDA